MTHNDRDGHNAFSRVFVVLSDVILHYSTSLPFPSLPFPSLPFPHMITSSSNTSICDLLHPPSLDLAVSLSRPHRLFSFLSFIHLLSSFSFLLSFSFSEHLPRHVNLPLFTLTPLLHTFPSLSFLLPIFHFFRHQSTTR